jgi:hypothetical protein
LLSDPVIKAIAVHRKSCTVMAGIFRKDSPLYGIAKILLYQENIDIFDFERVKK